MNLQTEENASMRPFAILALLLILIPEIGCQNETSSTSGKSLYLYAPDGASSVDQFTIGAGGTLIPMTPSSVQAGNSPRAVSATSQFAYVSNYVDGSVYEYSITNGLLNPLTPLSITGLSNPYNSVLSPNGQYLYVLETGAVAQFSIGNDGQLSSLPIASVGMSSQPNALAFAPSGAFAYTCTDTLLYTFSVSAGALNMLTTIPLTSCGAIAISPNGSYLYAALATGNILQYSIDTGGTLTPLSPSSVTGAVTGTTTDSLVITPNGNFLYAANLNATSGNGPIAQYGVGSNGTLTALSPLSVTAGAGPFDLIVTADGGTVYCSNTSDGTLSQMAVHPSGQLTFQAAAAVGGASFYPAIVNQ
jgi:6-phosphogluconolactonase (cycloisomerase 2 family)